MQYNSSISVNKIQYALAKQGNILLFIDLVNSQATAIVKYCTAGAHRHCVPQFTPQMEIHFEFLKFLFVH